MNEMWIGTKGGTVYTHFSGDGFPPPGVRQLTSGLYVDDEGVFWGLASIERARAILEAAGIKLRDEWDPHCPTCTCVREE